MAASALAAAALTAAALVIVGHPWSPRTVIPPIHISPLPDNGVTPPGWAPVAVGVLQISVPSLWAVQDPGYSCGGGINGFVFVNQNPFLTPAIPQCSYPESVVSMVAVSGGPPENSRLETVNGIQVESWSSSTRSEVTYFEQADSVRVGARGPEAEQVLASITHSPLSVVLDSNVETVPTGWRDLSFGGIAFSIPAGWAVRQVQYFGECGYQGALGGSAVLDGATAQSQPIGCPPPPPQNLPGPSGLVIEDGPLAAASVPAGAQCKTRNNLRICIDLPEPSADNPDDNSQVLLGNLTAQVFVPGHKSAEQVYIALDHTGTTALNVLDSFHSQ